MIFFSQIFFFGTGAGRAPGRPVENCFGATSCGMDLETILLSINGRRGRTGVRGAKAPPAHSTALVQPWKPSGALAASDPFEEHPPEGRTVSELLTVPRRAVELDLLSTERWQATKAAADAWPLGLLTTHVVAPAVLAGDGGPQAVGSVPAAVQAMLLAAGISPPPSVSQIMRVAEAYLHETKLEGALARFDVIAVLLGDGEPHVEHFENAFGMFG